MSPSPDSARGPTDTAPSLLVLVVDDNTRNLKLACEVLGAAGIRTLEATTGRDAIALAREQQPDVILLDLRLPDMDGTEAARELGGRAETAHIPVVALTAVHVEGHASDWLPGSSFAGYLPKPIDVLQLPEQVRGYCAEASG